MLRAVYFYRETYTDGTDDIYTLCKLCANLATEAGDQLELIDRAPDSDGCCRCDCEPLPEWYSPKPKFIAGVLNDF